MGKKQQKGKSGNAANYITRNQAINRLQIKLAEFRRLCILKGIHPREPKKKTQGTHKTYYHVKDIDFLAHEPLLNISRDMKAYEKKLKKAKAKQMFHTLERLKKNKPTYALDHLVKERYPAFVDALRDMDDALCLIHLFAVLPAEKSLGIPVQRIHTARRLSVEWQAYVTRTNALRKVFVSVKGIYFQAEVVGQTITWIVPHQLSQVIPDDVDFRVMLTFLEFYETLVSFVNFKLYHELGLAYPPVLDPKLETAAAELYATMRQLAETAQRKDSEAKAIAAAAAAAAVDPSAGSAAAAAAANGSSGKVVGDVREKGGAQASGEGMEDEGDAGNKRKKEREQEEQEMEELAQEEVSARMAAFHSRLAAIGAAQKLNEKRNEVAGSADGAEKAAAQSGDSGGGAAGSAEGDGVAQEGEEDEEEDEETKACRRLFRGLVFFLAREVPREPLLFVIRSFGGTVAWEGPGSPMGESDERITHQVVDRPRQQKRLLSRDYVQPQWVFDCANARLVLPPADYAPGKVPPPHLSPFVDDKEEGYKPDYAVVIERLKAAAAAASTDAAAAAASGAAGGGELLLMDGASAEEVKEGAHLQALAAARLEEKAAAAKLAEAEALERAYADDLARELAGVPFSASAQVDGEGEASGNEEEGGEEEGNVDEEEGGEGTEDGEEDEGTKAEGTRAGKRTKRSPPTTTAGTADKMAPLKKKVSTKSDAQRDAERAAAAAAAAEEVEAKEMARLMMPRKTQKLYEAMQMGLAKKRAHMEQLAERKKKRAMQAVTAGEGKGQPSAASAGAAEAQQSKSLKAAKPLAAAGKQLKLKK